MTDPIAIALAEDIGSGDVTAEFFIDATQRGQARIISKQDRVSVAGAEIAAEVFSRVDSALRVTILRASGSLIGRRETVLEIDGSIRSILTAERVALNFLQRLSGIATLTRRFADAVAHTKAKILDTRKTTPGLRALEKAAVAAGGGTNHRFGLFDMAMVKDNHLAAQSSPEGLRQTIQKLRRDRPQIRVEFEADTLEQVETFLAMDGIDVILLDNMSLDELRSAVQLGKGRVQFEASGGVSLETVAAIAETGVDFISVGALTHSAPAVDFSLEAL